MKLDEANAAIKSACRFLLDTWTRTICSEQPGLQDIKHYRVLCLQRDQFVNTADTQ